MPSRLQMSKHTTEGRNCPPEDGRKRTSVQPQEGEPDFLERLRDGICTICLCAGRIRGERKLACPDRTPFQGWQVVFHHSGALQLPVHHWRVPAACEERLGVQDGFLQIQPLHWNMGLHCSTVEGKTLSKRVDGMDWPIGFFFFSVLKMFWGRRIYIFSSVVNPQHRRHFSAAACEGCIYAVGGWYLDSLVAPDSNTALYMAVESYDPWEDAWRSVHSPLQTVLAGPVIDCSPLFWMQSLSQVCVLTAAHRCPVYNVLVPWLTFSL